MLVHVEEGGAEPATLATNSSSAPTSHIKWGCYNDGTCVDEEQELQIKDRWNKKRGALRKAQATFKNDVWRYVADKQTHVVLLLQNEFGIVTHDKQKWHCITKQVAYRVLDPCI
jgi:hypothetical protein